MAELIKTGPIARQSRVTGERPLFFPSAGRPLYGAFHPPDCAVSKNGVLVICHSIGTEHMLTQRIEATLARVAARAGFAAFRYNSRAHGDSAGEPRELTFADLVEDACAAAQTARELSGASRIIWLGLRLGCIVAGEAMCRREDAAGLALWEPIHRGGDYFRSLLRATFFAHVAKGRRPGGTVDGMLDQIKRDGELPVIGGFINRALYDSTCGLDLLQSLQNWHGPTLIAQLQRKHKLSDDNEQLRSAICQTKDGGNVSVVMIAQEPPWNMMPIVKPQWMSNELLKSTKDWLDGLE